MSLRLPADTEQAKAMVDEDGVAQGTLLFSDGSQKTLAAFSVWLALLRVWKQHSDFIQNGQVVQLIGSFLLMRTTFRATDAVTNSLDGAIAKIVKQNTDSRVQPVSSFAWCSILSSMKQLTGGTET